MYKVCIISCGMIANSAHIPAYKMFDEFKIMAVCDINKIAAKDTAERHGIERWYTDAKQMLDEIKPDLVSVCVPNCCHKEYTLMALEAGANVLCEKPLGFTRKDACEMYELAEEKGRILMACQSMRFTPDRLSAKEYITANPDDVYYGELSRVRRRGIPTWGTFHINKISCGGAFVDIGVHMLDALLWLMGNPQIESVSGTTMQNHKYETGSLVGSGALTGEVHNARQFEPDEMDVEDFACGMLSFTNGAKVSFKVAWAANIPESSDIMIVGKKYGISVPSGDILSGEKACTKLQTEPCPYETPFPGHIYLIKNMLGVLNGEEKPIVTPEETINVATILELFYKSAKEGREVFATEI